MLYKSGVGYSYINTTRSALFSYLTLGKGVSAGQPPLVKRFLKGVYNKRPIVPRYQQTWDVNLVLDYLKTLSPVNIWSLRTLSLKLVMLLALIIGQRVHTLHSLDLTFMNIEDDHVNIAIYEIL
jgi:hypothetical protein